MPAAPSRTRDGSYYCYCPTCDYHTTVEEGQKCNELECPRGHGRMRATTIGKYRVSQGELGSSLPLLLTLGAFGLLAFIIAKRPLG